VVKCRDSHDDVRDARDVLGVARAHVERRLVESGQKSHVCSAMQVG
jgi:hypothetical protein